MLIEKCKGTLSHVNMCAHPLQRDILLLNKLSQNMKTVHNCIPCKPKFKGSPHFSGNSQTEK